MNASVFDQQLLRLKSALGVTADQQVAEALGLSKAALSDRKKRGAFPEDKLWALAQRRPELQLNPFWVLSGQSDEVMRATAGVLTAQIRTVLTMQADRWKDLPVAEQLTRAMEVVEAASLEEDERELVLLFRGMKPAARKRLLIELKQADSGELSQQQKARNEVGMRLHASGNGVVQVGHVGGSVRIKKPKGR